MLARVRWVPVLFVSFAFVMTAAAARAATDWPQYRGPHRDGVSGETGLLKRWPEKGPGVVWRKKIGDGFSSIVVSGGRLFTMDSDAESEVAVCLEIASGKDIWRTTLDKRFVEEFGDGPRATPVVDGDLMFNLTSYGKLFALKTSDGSKVWDVDIIATFGGRQQGRGAGSTPIVEGDLLILEGGGTEGKAIQALDKRTGATKWTSQNGPAGYASPIAVTIDGTRQIIFARTGTGEIVSLLPDGTLAWSHKWVGGVIAMPVFVAPNRIFASAADDAGSTLIEVLKQDGKFVPKEVWSSRSMKNHFNSSVLVGDHLYGFDNATLKCISIVTGEQKWVQRGFGKGSLIAADGMLVVLGDQGLLALAEAVPDGYHERGRFSPLTGKTWTAPSLSGGRLYLRDQDELVSINLTGAGKSGAGM